MAFITYAISTWGVRSTAIDCDLYQTFYNCSLLAIGSYWHCRSLANQCSVPPDGTYKHHIGILLQTKIVSQYNM